MEDSFGFVLVLMLLAVCVGGYFSALPDDDKATAALTSAGYSEPAITGSSVITLKCSQSDSKVFDFSALNPAGEPSTGFVCCGIFKGCTVRH